LLNFSELAADCLEAGLSAPSGECGREEFTELLEKADTSFETVSFELREMSKKKCEGLGDDVVSIG
jgi:hypothetical protein